MDTLGESSASDWCNESGMHGCILLKKAFNHNVSFPKEDKHVINMKLKQLQGYITKISVSTFFFPEWVNPILLKQIDIHTQECTITTSWCARMTSAKQTTGFLFYKGEQPKWPITPKVHNHKATNNKRAMKQHIVTLYSDCWTESHAPGKSSKINLAHTNHYHNPSP